MNTRTPLRSTSPQANADTWDLTPLTGRAPRTALPDRIAMRVALALMLWSSRPARRDSLDPEAALRARREAAEREEREQRWLRQVSHLRIY